MTTAFLSSVSTAFAALRAAVVTLLLPIVVFFGYDLPVEPVVTEAPQEEIVIEPSPVDRAPVVATSSPAKAKPVIPVPVVALPVVVAKPPVVTPSPAPVPVTPPVTPPVIPPEQRVLGTTTLAIQRIPLLFGTSVHAGGTVPVLYLQITNIGTAGALLTGFEVRQVGSAPTASVIGLSTVDDTGVLRTSVGGVDGGTVFKKSGLALAPTDAYFAPGQMRLFTVKAIMTSQITPYVGTELVLELASIETTAVVKGQFPILGTTWVLAE